MYKIQSVYVPVKVEDELPNKEACGISNKNELLVGYIRSTEHSHTGYEISNDDTSMTSVDRWLKPQEGYFFTEEQLNELLSNVIKDTLDAAAEKAKGFTDGNELGVAIHIDKRTILNTFEETYKKHKV